MHRALDRLLYEIVSTQKLVQRMSSIRNINSTGEFMRSELLAYLRRMYAFCMNQAGQLCHLKPGVYQGSLQRFPVR